MQSVIANAYAGSSEVGSVSAFPITVDPTAETATRLCLLFDDQVTDHLCALRKCELDGRGAFSYGGCGYFHHVQCAGYAAGSY
jgi:hypothetical protein